MRLRPLAGLLLLVLAGCGGGGTGEQPGAFVLVRELPAGSWVHIRDMNGSITAEPSVDGMLHVTATRRWRGRRPQEVRFRTVDEGDGFVICAVWSERGECSSDRYTRSQPRSWLQWLRPRGRTTVDFQVRVPAGIALDARTVNGAVRASGMSAELVLRTVNGAVHGATIGRMLDARTVNGAVTGVVGGGGSGPVHLESVNGRVEAQLPAGTAATVELSTVNGRLTSDFPLATQSAGSRRLEGTIGGGGRPVRLSTVNGSVTLRAGS